MNQINGYKTWIGIAGLLLTQIAASFLNVDMDVAGAGAAKILALIEAAFGALTLIGFGHKLDKGPVVK